MQSNMYYHHQPPSRKGSPGAISLQIPTQDMLSAMHDPPDSNVETTDFESETDFPVSSFKQKSRATAPAWPSKKRQSPESFDSLYTKAIYMMEALSDSDSSTNQSTYSKSSLKTATTASSLDEARTPAETLSYTKYGYDGDPAYETPATDGSDIAVPTGIVTQGPKGPHLFSPIEDERKLFMDPNHRPMSTISAAMANLNESEYSQWTPDQVCAWMKELGFEASLIAKFRENDMSGVALSELKWEDLKELDIQSFGKRIELWSAVKELRGNSAPSSPASRSKPSSPITESQRELPVPEEPSESSEAEADRQTQRHRTRAVSSRRHRQQHRRSPSSSVVMPEDSVSSRGIKMNSDDEVSEVASAQTPLPPPPPVVKPRKHKCSKGPKCAKHGQLRKPKKGSASPKTPPLTGDDGSILLGTTPSLLQYGFNTFQQEIIDDPNEVNSAVPSSDALGGIGYELELKADRLRAVARLDPQENVRHFVALQHLRSLKPDAPARPAITIPERSNIEIMRADLIQECTAPSPFDRCKTPALSLRTQDLPPMPHGAGIPRHTTQTPFSDLDVPRSNSLSPVYPQRELSNSVPPDMRYRESVDGPTFNQLPSIKTVGLMRRRTQSPPIDPTTNTYMSPVDEIVEEFGGNQRGEHQADPDSPSSPSQRFHAGYIKKRRTALFRHEYRTYHCRLQGARLGFYSKEQSKEEIGFIDMNYYSVGCAAASKPSGVFKVGGKSSDSDGNYFFQLMPNLDGGKTKGPGVGKIHYMAVTSKEERFAWMRELMLAKLAQKKTSGFAVEINGNVI